MSRITVRIDSSRPVFIEADADNFGQIFAGMSDEEQVNVLRAIVEHMKPHRIQWDYIALALEKDENRDVREQLSVILPDIAAKDAEIDKLKAALEKLEKAASDFHDATAGHLTDSTYDADGVLANAEAELSVIAIPAARSALKGDAA